MKVLLSQTRKKRLSLRDSSLNTLCGGDIYREMLSNIQCRSKLVAGENKLKQEVSNEESISKHIGKKAIVKNGLRYLQKPSSIMLKILTKSKLEVKRGVQLIFQKGSYAKNAIVLSLQIDIIPTIQNLLKSNSCVQDVISKDFKRGD